MDTVSPYLTKIKEMMTLDQLKKWISNPYLAGVIGMMVVVYGGFMAPQLPPSVAGWFANPLFKIFCIFILLLVHRINPVVSIVLALALVISIQTMSRYKVVGAVKQMAQQLPTAEESAQFNQEVRDEMLLRQMEHNPQVEDHEPLAGLHPMNRPTEETLYQDTRIEDPNDPAQPAMKMMNDPTLNTAIYELNPPFAQKEVPEAMKGEQVNVSSVHLPKGGPTRYSAYHGYTIA